MNPNNYDQNMLFPAPAPTRVLNEIIPQFIKMVNEDYKPTNEDKTVCDKTERRRSQHSKYYANFIVKFDKKYKIIQYDKQFLSDDLIKSYGLIRSVVVNPLNKVVCFSPPKALLTEQFIQENSTLHNIIAEEFVEGTMINVFWDPTMVNDGGGVNGGVNGEVNGGVNGEVNGGFQIATRKNVGADASFFKNPDGSKGRTFKSMFLETIQSIGLNINALNPEYCYSFVLQHPENRIVLKITEPQLYLVAAYKINHCDDIVRVDQINLNEIQMQLMKGHMLPTSTLKIKFPEIYINWSNYSDLIDKYASPNSPHNVLGVILRNTETGDRCKIRNPVYEEIKQLRGNQPKIQYQYLSLRLQGKVGAFLKHYPEQSTQFSMYRDQLHIFTNNLFKNYICCYVKKEHPLIDYPLQYRTHMFNLHMKYINELSPARLYVNNRYVIEYINKLPAAQLMFSLNYHFRNYTLNRTEPAV